MTWFTKSLIGFYMLLFVLALLSCSCARRSGFLSGDPQATFVAHEANGVLVVDRIPQGQPTSVQPKGTWRLGRAPYIPSEAGAGDWSLSLDAPGEVTIARARRQGTYERVVPSWDDNAIRLTLERNERPLLRTDVLARVAGAGTSHFSRLAVLSVDVRGTYEGDVRDRVGTRIGWLRLRVGASDAHVVCEGVLPPDVDEAMVAATTLALVSEVDWIEDHVRGVSRGPFERP